MNQSFVFIVFYRRVYGAAKNGTTAAVEGGAATFVVNTTVPASADAAPDYGVVPEGRELWPSLLGGELSGTCLLLRANG